MSSETGGGAAENEPSQQAPSSGRVVSWQPNEEYLRALLGMGVSRNASERALYYTGNQSADLAAAWIFEHTGEDLDAPLNLDDESQVEVELEGSETDAYKMVFVVNIELGMSVGKIAAQVAHAAFGMHRKLMQTEEKFGEQMFIWEEHGEKKVTLQGESTEHLLTLENDASQMGLPTFLVTDAGYTQVAPNSLTVLCLFGHEDLVNEVTGKLKLL